MLAGNYVAAARLSSLYGFRRKRHGRVGSAKTRLFPPTQPNPLVILQ